VVDQRPDATVEAHQDAPRTGALLAPGQHAAEQAAVLAFQAHDQRKGGIHRHLGGCGPVYAGGHGVEKDVRQALSHPPVAELLQGLLAPVATRPDEPLSRHAQLLRPGEQARREECLRRLGQAVEPAVVDEALARKVRTRHQQMLRPAVVDQPQAVRLVRQEPVAAGFEAETLDRHGLHRAARSIAGVEDRQLPLRAGALEIEGGGQAADPGPGDGDSHGAKSNGTSPFASP
jgi:hypothetical protein